MPAHTTIRALLVDDSAGPRRALSDALGVEPDVEVIGTAATMRSALARIAELNPNVIVTKYDWPDNGLSWLKSLCQSGHSIPVVVFDVQMIPGSPRNLDARLAGAAACVARPAESERLADAVRNALAPVLRMQCKDVVNGPRDIPRPPESTRPVTRAPDSVHRRAESAAIVAIASSTGGPDALVAVLSDLPQDFRLPVVIVQHMPQAFTTSLAERLATHTRRRVEEARDAVPLDAADIWIAPGGRHLLVEKTDRTTWLRLSDAEPENSCRPSADVLFRSVAAAFGSRSLVVVLTGMGQDGMLGCQAIRQSGGQILAQDQATSVVWAMPRAVVEAGLADAILPLSNITAEILRRCRRSEA